MPCRSLIWLAGWLPDWLIDFLFLRGLLSPFDSTVEQVIVHAVYSNLRLAFIAMQDPLLADCAPTYSTCAPLVTRSGLGAGWAACRSGLNEALKSAASSLLPRLTGPISQVFLNVLQEEIRRLQGRRWSAVFPKV
jgi:hypothetical protein